MLTNFSRFLVLLLFVSLPCSADDQKAPDEKLLREVREILQKVPLIDGHNDLPWIIRDKFQGHLDRVDLRKDTRLLALETPMHTDISRLKEGGVGGQFWSVYIPVEVKGLEAIKAVLEQIDIVQTLSVLYPDVFEMAYTADDIERIHAAHRIACLIGIEGGHAIDNSLVVLRDLYRTGARYMTLTHWKNTDWADSATAKPEHGGLTDFGRQVVLEMNWIGMLVDLSHVSPETMNDALDVARAPVIFSHSSVLEFSGHPRNVPDDVLKRLPQNGGVVMINFATAFVSEDARQYSAVKAGEEKRLQTLYPQDPERVRRELKAWQETHPDPGATLEQVANHIDAARKIAGIDHIGIGSDFDGISSTPKGLEDVSRYPALLAELLRRGYSKDDIAKIAGLNVLRVLRECEKVAAQMQKERPPLQFDLEKLKTSEN